MGQSKAPYNLLLKPICGTDVRLALALWIWTCTAGCLWSIKIIYDPPEKKHHHEKADFRWLGKRLNASRLMFHNLAKQIQILIKKSV